MGFDLSLCTVPKQIDGLIEKATQNPDYAEMIAFAPFVLKRGALTHVDDLLRKQFNQDTLALRQSHSYTDDDFFDDHSRESSTLDYLFDQLILETGFSIDAQILWRGGRVVCKHCRAVQGIPVRLYDTEAIQQINRFFSLFPSAQLLSHYEYERMREHGVYKLTRPEWSGILVDSCDRLKRLFQRAEHHSLWLINVID